MTPLDALLAAGLSLEEAQLILARREAAANAPTQSQKLTRAMEALAKAQKRVGVHPVVVEGGWIEKEHDPEAEEGFLSFYANKGAGAPERPKRKLNRPVVPVEDQSQDPEDG